MNRCTPTIHPRRRFLAAGLALLGLALPGAALRGDGLVDPAAMPGTLKEVRFDQRIGEKLPLDARLRDESGQEVELGRYFQDRPVVLAFVYYECPMLCSLVLEGVAKSLAVIRLEAGSDYDLVAISIDPEETPELARAVKAETMARYGSIATGRSTVDEGWHFLTGEAAEVRRIADAAGFHYAYVPEKDEWAHAGGIIVATPDGTLAQYYYGFEYPPKDVRLALVEASGGELGSVVDQVLLYCFRYDPALGKYTAVITRVLRLAGVVFLVALGLFLWLMLRHERLAAPTAQPKSTLGAA